MRWGEGFTGRWRLLAFVVFGLALGACGGNGGGGSGSSEADAGQPEESEPEQGGIDLSGVTLARDDTAALSAVEVLGLPAGIGSADLYATYHVQDTGDATAMTATGDRLVPLLSRDNRVVVIPPLVDPDGGAIELEITDGASRSPPLSLELEALPPPRSGALDEVLAAFDEVLAATAAEMGLAYPDSLEHRRDHGFDQMPPTLLPLMRSWLAIADPDNPDSLASRRQTLDADARMLLERVFADGALASALETQAELVRDGDSALDHAVGVHVVEPLTSAHGQEAVTHSGTFGAGRLDGSAILPIEGPAALSQALQEYEDKRARQQDTELFVDIFGPYAAMVSLAAGPGGAAVRGVAAGLDWTVHMADATFNQARTARWFLPCCIEDMAMELDPPDGVIAHEDAEANQIGVESVEATVVSEGVELDRGAMRRVVRRLVDEEGMSPALEEHYEKIREDLLDDDADVMTALDDWVDRVSGTELVFYWEDIELADASPRLWLEPELDTFAGAGEPILADAGGGMIDPYEFHLVTPQAFERDDTILRMRPDPDRFPQSPWTTLSAASEQISLNRIEVDFEPSSHTGVEAGERVTFTVTVDNADDTGLQAPEIDGVGAVAEFAEKDSDPGVYELAYQAPDPLPEEPGITEIHTFASTQGGIRGDAAAPPRHGTGFVSFAATDEDDEDHAEVTDSFCGPRPVGATVEYHRGDYWFVPWLGDSGTYRVKMGADKLEVLDISGGELSWVTYELIEVLDHPVLDGDGEFRDGTLTYRWGNPDGTFEPSSDFPVDRLSMFFFSDQEGWCWFRSSRFTTDDPGWGRGGFDPGPNDPVHARRPGLDGEPPP